MRASAVDTTIPIQHVAPADQPTTVHEIATRLFPAYTVDGGGVHLAGCYLDDCLFARLSFRRADDVIEVYVDANGEEVPGGTVAALGMAETAPIEKPPHPYRASVERMIEAGTQLAVARLPAGETPELLRAQALWCKHVEGKLRFSVGEAMADLPFSGWGRTLQPPAYVCPFSGVATFHLAATDDGRLAAAEEVARCEYSGRRVLKDELVTCSATGRRVKAELCTPCPVCGEQVLVHELVHCGMCQQLVSPRSIERGICEACRQLKPVSKADPRMARLLDEYPPLDGWRSWQLAETSMVYVLVAGGWFKRLLLVVDKESLEIRYMATAARLLGRWQTVEPSQHAYALRG